MNRLKFLREERSRIAGEMKAIVDSSKNEQGEARSLSSEEKNKWNNLKGQLPAIEEEISILEEQEKIDSRSAKPVASAPAAAPSENRPTSVSQDFSIRSQVAKWMEDNKETIEASRRNAVPLPPIQLRAVA